MGFSAFLAWQNLSANNKCSIFDISVLWNTDGTWVNWRAVTAELLSRRCHAVSLCVYRPTLQYSKRRSAVTSFCIVASSAPRAGGRPTWTRYLAYVIPLHYFSRERKSIPLSTQDLRPCMSSVTKWIHVFIIFLICLLVGMDIMVISFHCLSEAVITRS